ncbi:LysR family transcriptional regulator [Roseobacter sp.]|uniref:LysR family transcriptional regulator n=1 Tax=Roseobacter sp. TaxID=1907202 RepID=UPI00385DA0AD
MQNLRIYRYIDRISRTGSIRQAAEQLSITPSALNRRVIALEQELDVEIFDRLGRGVRLSTAGELLIDTMRKHLAETDTLKSRIADLSGLRRGHVSIACSQAVLPYLLPEQIRDYQAEFPQVTFSVMNKDGSEAAEALLNYSADLAIVFDPLRQAEFHTVFAMPQPIHAIMASDHPLSGKTEVSLSECLDFPLALPTAHYGVRKTIEVLSDKLSTRVTPTVEADSYVLLQHYVARTQAIGFELKIGLPQAVSHQLVSRPLKNSQSKLGSLFIVHLKGRSLPVAATRFAQQFAETLAKLKNAD